MDAPSDADLADYKGLVKREGEGGGVESLSDTDEIHERLVRSELCSRDAEGADRGSSAVVLHARVPKE